MSNKSNVVIVDGMSPNVLTFYNFSRAHGDTIALIKKHVYKHDGRFILPSVPGPKSKDKVTPRAKAWGALTREFYVGRLIDVLKLKEHCKAKGDWQAFAESIIAPKAGKTEGDNAKTVAETKAYAAARSMWSWLGSKVLREMNQDSNAGKGRGARGATASDKPAKPKGKPAPWFAEHVHVESLDEARGYLGALKGALHRFQAENADLLKDEFGSSVRAAIAAFNAELNKLIARKSEDKPAPKAKAA